VGIYTIEQISSRTTEVNVSAMLRAAHMSLYKFCPLPILGRCHADINTGTQPESEVLMQVTCAISQSSYPYIFCRSDIWSLAPESMWLEEVWLVTSPPGQHNDGAQRNTTQHTGGPAGHQEPSMWMRLKQANRMDPVWGVQKEAIINKNFNPGTCRNSSRHHPRSLRRAKHNEETSDGSNSAGKTLM
jgi:hypothetical protein